MEKEFDSKLSIQSNSSHGKTSQRYKSFAFRAPQENFTIQDFELGKIYGVGSYSKVVRAKRKDTGIMYALKIMDKNFITKENKTAYVKLERIVLDQLDHPGIIRLYFTFQDTYSLYMALESCEGGELFDQITRKGRLSEDEARFYTAEVVEALEYIHNLGLLHRDIKPENLLLTSDGHIKIADFGSVKPMQDSPITVMPNAASDDKACTFVGTAAYVPPEVLNSSPATVGNDLWALGCTLYQMLSGTSPFKDASEWLIFQKIIARDITFPDYFSDEARDLIDRLLDVDPTKRPGAGPDGYVLLKKHPFFSGLSWDNLRMQTPPKLAPEQKLKKYYKKLIAYAIFQPSMTGTHYDILGVKEDATYEEIRTSYRSSILNHHPDKVPKTAEVSNSINFHEDRFLEIQRAWKILSSPTSRSIYDIELQTLRQDATTSEDVSLEDMTVEEADDVVELLYQCRCGDCFSIDSKELKEMGYLLLRDGDSISLQMLNELHAFPASVVLPCGSCSLKIRVLINSANYVR